MATFIVTEFGEGMTLEHLIRGNPLEIQKAVELQLERACEDFRFAVAKTTACWTERMTLSNQARQWAQRPICSPSRSMAKKWMLTQTCCRWVRFRTRYVWAAFHFQA